MPATLLLPDDVKRTDDDDIDPVVEILPERFEFVHGSVVEVPVMSQYSTRVANRLNRALMRYLDRNDIGESDIEQMFHIPNPDDPGRGRRPDLAFTSYERWPKNRPMEFRGNAMDVVPDLAVEVVSPTDPADDLLAKVREYLRGGVRLVWVVYPLAQEIHAYWPEANTVRVYLAADDLDAGDVLPDFRSRVGDLFPPVESGPA